MRTFKQWLIKNFTAQELARLAKASTIRIFPKLSYHAIGLYRQFQVEIWEILERYAETQDKALVELIPQLRYAKFLTRGYPLTHDLVWQAAKVVAETQTKAESPFIF